MKKLLPLFIVLLLLVVVASGYAYQMKTHPTAPSQVQNQFLVYQAIQNDPKTTPNFVRIRVDKGATALDLLKKTTQLKTSGEGANAFVTAINGREASKDKKEFWAFYVNGKQAEVGAGSYKLQPNDKVLWKIENY